MTNPLPTKTLSREKWYELEGHFQAIKDITDVAEDLDYSTVSENDSYPSIVWRTMPYIIKPEKHE